MAGQETSWEGPLSPEMDPASGGLPLPEAKLNFAPTYGRPGNLVVFEAGPLPGRETVALDFYFPGSVSLLHHADNSVYGFVIIGFDTEAGRYPISLMEGESALAEEVLEIRDKSFAYSEFTMPPGRTEGWTAERLAEDREKIRRARDTSAPYPLWSDLFIRPLEGRITSTYGAVRVINNNPPRRHNGVDIGSPEGTPVLAANCGIVRLAEFLLAGGETVIIDHGIGLSTTYMHLSTIDIEEGQRVRRGEKIGEVGMTGYATGPHLHWEANLRNDRPVNPEQLLADYLIDLPLPYGDDHFPEQP